MATRFFFLGFVVLLTIQGLSTSSLSKRDFWSDAASELKSLASNAANNVNQLVQNAEQQANATIQAALGNVTAAVKQGIAAGNAAVAKINNTIQEIADTAKAVVANATQELDALEGIAEAKITDFTNTLKKYGNGALGCVYNNSDTIKSVIGTAGSSVYNCTASVVQTATPMVKDAIETAAKLVDLSNKVTTITATCAPAAATLVLAVPCYLLQAGLALGDIINDINVITADVNDFIAKAPGLKQEIQTCSAVVKNATTNVYNLLGQIESCVNTYVNSSS